MSQRSQKRFEVGTISAGDVMCPILAGRFRATAAKECDRMSVDTKVRRMRCKGVSLNQTALGDW